MRNGVMVIWDAELITPLLHYSISCRSFAWLPVSSLSLRVAS